MSWTKEDPDIQDGPDGAGARTSRWPAGRHGFDRCGPGLGTVHDGRAGDRLLLRRVEAPAGLSPWQGTCSRGPASACGRFARPTSIASTTRTSPSERGGSSRSGHVRAAFRREFAEHGFWQKTEGCSSSQSRDEIAGHIEFFRPVPYWDAFELPTSCTTTARRSRLRDRGGPVLVDYLSGPRRSTESTW